MKQMKMENNPTPKQNAPMLKDILPKVKEVLARYAHYAHLTAETVMALIRKLMQKLQERGIWPSSGKGTQPTSNEGTQPHRAENPKFPKPFSAENAPAPSTYGQQLQANTAQVKLFLQHHYEVRYNLLEHCAEVRHRPDARFEETECAESDQEFHLLNDVALNTIVLHLHECGIPCWDRDVTRILHSRLMPQYHPLDAYLQHLPAWDGTDRLTPLARRVSDHPLWLTAFGCWMRAMVRQWQGRAALEPEIGENGTDSPDSPHGVLRSPSNQLALILISHEQGLHKSTFCRMILPEALRPYFTDKFELAARTNLEFPLCRYALINLDEFDRYSSAQMTKLKNLMQLGTISVRRPRARNFELLRRTASFIGTSNTGELLTDPTGSRRFYCQEVDHLIDCDTPIDYDQLYAQLLHELGQGCPYYLSKEEEARVQQHNRAYYKASALCEAFQKIFRAPEATDAEGAAPGAQWLSATEIFKEMHDTFGSRLLAGTPSQLGRQLTFLQVEKKHTNRGTLYCVQRLVEGGRQMPDSAAGK